jgi:outer membrane protein
MIEEITKSAVEIAKKKGATFLLDKSGPTLVGVSNILYFDPSLDITDEVATELNKDRPAATAAPAASTTATPAAPAATGDSPKITVPGIK